MNRRDGREPDQIRAIEIQRRFTTATPGSVLYRCGGTHVFATASIDERVPKWMSGRGRGWVTAEYAMLPGSTKDRKPRSTSTGRVDGRAQEIQRLVGRALRSVVDLKSLGERTVWLDCDVLQADGGTRTACLNAAYVALCDALRTYPFKTPLSKWPIEEPMGAMSAGIVGGRALVDLDYSEDHRAEVDMNVVMTASGRFLEIQGTGESRPFSEEELEGILALCRKGITDAMESARAALTEPLGMIPGPIYVATTNAHKAAEIAAILAPSGLDVRPAPDLPEVVEDGATFRDNAILKARAAAAALGRPALADDSGLVVDVLGGAPGVHSARYAGEGAGDQANNDLLVERLTALGVEDPAAAFVCHVVIAAPDGTLVAEGEGRVEGVIRWPEQGERGFGYDPLFFHPPSGCRLSELTPEAKNAVSHRGAALRRVAAALEA